jgi:hypothetical protein
MLAVGGRASLVSRREVIAERLSVCFRDGAVTNQEMEEER